MIFAILCYHKKAERVFRPSRLIYFLGSLTLPKEPFPAPALLSSSARLLLSSELRCPLFSFSSAQLFPCTKRPKAQRQNLLDYKPRIAYPCEGVNIGFGEDTPNCGVMEQCGDFVPAAKTKPYRSRKLPYGFYPAALSCITALSPAPPGLSAVWDEANHPLWHSPAQSPGAPAAPPGTAYGVFRHPASR